MLSCESGEWQTRTFEGRMVNTVWVQVPSLAQNSKIIGFSNKETIFFFEQTK